MRPPGGRGFETWEVQNEDSTGGRDVKRGWSGGQGSGGGSVAPALAVALLLPRLQDQGSLHPCFSVTGGWTLTLQIVYSDT